VLLLFKLKILEEKYQKRENRICLLCNIKCAKCEKLNDLRENFFKKLQYQINQLIKDSNSDNTFNIYQLSKEKLTLFILGANFDDEICVDASHNTLEIRLEGIYNLWMKRQNLLNSIDVRDCSTE